MRKFNIKTLLIYVLIISYLLFVNLYGYKHIGSVLTDFITPLFFIITFILSLLLSNTDTNQRIKVKKNKYQSIFIIIISYLIIYMLSGLILGYVRSIYSHSILGIIKNTWIYILPVIFTELTRNILIKNTGKNKFFFMLITIIFAIIDINIYNLIGISETKSDWFQNTFSIIVPCITKSFSLTYISKTSGFIANLIYVIPLEITNIILPIYPNLDWYFKGLIEILLPILTFIKIKSLEDKIEAIEERTKTKESSLTKNIILITPLVIFALFVAGLFKYKPTAIVSNSMHPIYNRGDAVVIEKINKKNIKKLKKYDIIEYKLNNTIVAHRIIHIEKHNDGSKLYITKGDNNNVADKLKVNPNQIVGIVKFKIPKIGYPSVWLNDFFNKKEAPVETGN